MDSPARYGSSQFDQFPPLYLPWRFLNSITVPSEAVLEKQAANFFPFFGGDLAEELGSNHQWCPVVARSVFKYSKTHSRFLVPGSFCTAIIWRRE